jgi:hypothetical protein
MEASTVWIFTKRGYYSVIQYPNDPDHLVVRARVRGDIEQEFPSVRRVHETADHDYRFRARVPRVEVIAAMSKAVEGITYSNYKAAVIDQRRSYDYGLVWLAMANMQDALAEEGR